MKKIIVLLLGAALIMALAACGRPAEDSAPGGNDDSGQTDNQSGGQSQIANPWTDCATLDEACSTAGFTFVVPEFLLDSSHASYRATSGADAVLEVSYARSEGDIVLRKGFEREGHDVSGDYNTYPITGTMEVAGLEVTVKGENETVYCAVWTADGFDYAILADKGLSRLQLVRVLEAIG